MAIITTSGIVRPNQQNSTGAIDALTIEEFTGIVQGTIERKSAISPFIKPRPVRGTNTITNYAVGETQLTTLKPGEAPDSTPVDFSKISVVVDTVPMARNVIPLLEDFQNNFGARQKVAMEHGKTIAKLVDQSYMIQGIKAALLANSAYSGGTAGKPAGFKGGNKITLGAAADVNDPAKLLKSFADLMVKFEEKDVVPQAEDIIIVLRPTTFYTLLQAEQIINGEYKTAEGTSVTGVPIFKSWGVPVVSSNNLPNSNIIGHPLSTTGNGNAYDGDFSKVVALAMSPQALLAGETIPLTSDVWFDKLTKQNFIDSWLAFAATPDRAEFAGVVLTP